MNEEVFKRMNDIEIDNANMNGKIDVLLGLNVAMIIFQILTS